MKKMIIPLAAAAFLLSGCSKYSSDYDAVGFVHNDLSDEAYMDFYKFDGHIVFDLDGSEGSRLEYSGKLEKGSITVSIDSDGRKKELFSLSDSSEVTSSLDLPQTDTVYLIVETSGSCENGDIHFNIR